MDHLSHFVGMPLHQALAPPVLQYHVALLLGLADAPGVIEQVAVLVTHLGPRVLRALLAAIELYGRQRGPHRNNTRTAALAKLTAIKDMLDICNMHAPEPGRYEREVLGDDGRALLAELRAKCTEPTDASLLASLEYVAVDPRADSPTHGLSPREHEMMRSLLKRETTSVMAPNADWPAFRNTPRALDLYNLVRAVHEMAPEQRALLFRSMHTGVLGENGGLLYSTHYCVELVLRHNWVDLCSPDVLNSLRSQLLFPHPARPLLVLADFEVDLQKLARLAGPAAQRAIMQQAPRSTAPVHVLLSWLPDREHAGVMECVARALKTGPFSPLKLMQCMLAMVGLLRQRELPDAPLRSSVRWSMALSLALTLEAKRPPRHAMMPAHHWPADLEQMLSEIFPAREIEKRVWKRQADFRAAHPDERRYSQRQLLTTRLEEQGARLEGHDAVCDVCLQVDLEPTRFLPCRHFRPCAICTTAMLKVAAARRGVLSCPLCRSEAQGIAEDPSALEGLDTALVTQARAGALQPRPVTPMPAALLQPQPDELARAAELRLKALRAVCFRAYQQELLMAREHYRRLAADGEAMTSARLRQELLRYAPVLPPPPSQPGM